MYEDLPSVLTIEEAIAANSFHGHENLLQDVCYKMKQRSVWDPKVCQGTMMKSKSSYAYPAIEFSARLG